MSQQVAVGNAGGNSGSGSGVDALTDLSGHYKRATSTAETLGSNDGDAQEDQIFGGGAVTSGTFSVDLASFLTFPVQDSSLGALTFTSSGTASPFGVFTGTSTAFDGNEFLLVEGGEVGSSARKLIGFAGVPTTTFPTSGATFYSGPRDFVLDSEVPFVRLSSGGSTAFTALPVVNSAIYWDNSGSSSAVRPFGAVFGGVSGTQSSQVSVLSIQIGEVVSVTIDGVAKTFIRGEVRGSSRVSGSQQPHFFEGPMSTVFGGSASAGTSFCGSGAGFFVTEAVETSSVGTKLTVDNKIADVFTTISAAEEYSPNTVFSSTTDTLGTRSTKTRNGYVGGLMEPLSSGGTPLSVRAFQTFNSDPTKVDVETNATVNKMAAGFQGENIFSSGIQIFSLEFGDHDPLLGDSSTTSGV